MKYLTMQNYAKLVTGNSTGKDDPEELKEWYAVGAEYIAELEKCKPVLPKRFIQLYERESFHDWEVFKIEFYWTTSKKLSYSADIFLETPYTKDKFWGCQLTLQELYSYNLDYPRDFGYPNYSRMDDIMFMEITKDDEGLICLGYNTPQESEFNFVFKKLKFKKLKTMPDSIRK